MGSPPLGPKPKSALPSYLLNRGPLLHGSTRARERDNLNSSIRSTYGRRAPIDFDSPRDASSSNGEPDGIKYSSDGQANGPIPAVDGHVSMSEAARDPRDGAAPITPPSTLSRPASPYTLNPPIDFDGLSWPSRSQPPGANTFLIYLAPQVSVLGKDSTLRQNKRKND